MRCVYVNAKPRSHKRRLRQAPSCRLHRTSSRDMERVKGCWWCAAWWVAHCVISYKYRRAPYGITRVAPLKLVYIRKFAYKLSIIYIRRVPPPILLWPTLILIIFLASILKCIICADQIRAMRRVFCVSCARWWLICLYMFLIQCARLWCVWSLFSLITFFG